LSGPEGTPAYDTTINVQALRRADAANRDLATAVQSFSRGLQGQGAKIDVSDPGTLAGAPAHFIYAAAKVGQAAQSGYTHIFRYILGGISLHRGIRYGIYCLSFNGGILSRSRGITAQQRG
jgi:hypothetical protein